MGPLLNIYIYFLLLLNMQSCLLEFWHIFVVFTSFKETIFTISMQYGILLHFILFSLSKYPVVFQTIITVLKTRYFFEIQKFDFQILHYYLYWSPGMKLLYFDFIINTVVYKVFSIAGVVYRLSGLGVGFKYNLFAS